MLWSRVFIPTLRDNPADAELRPWSRWITPEQSALRFDTRFYVALAPPHSPPKADGVEMIDAGWFAPQQATIQTYFKKSPSELLHSKEKKHGFKSLTKKPDHGDIFASTT